jgi:transposase
VVLIRPQSWERYGLKAWIEAAKKRLHHNVLAIALANKLARIAWAVLNKERYFEVTRTHCAFAPAGVSVAPARTLGMFGKLMIFRS